MFINVYFTDVERRKCWVDLLNRNECLVCKQPNPQQVLYLHNKQMLIDKRYIFRSDDAVTVDWIMHTKLDMYVCS